ncbi:hypothetical protein AYK24_06790 [Thermoplasmatales archaeon SG8-52-4]|nr:MAG: hypothetical protein AYK24_06790 [Thermoplasmatales archaeon SG8-52-4]
MRKILPFLIIGILVLGGLGASAIDIDKENTKLNENSRGTHTALGEYGTATWCGYCRYAHGALKELYAEGQLDFHYITYVCDKNSVASSYCASHYNLYGYPTVWFDGGYRVNVGAGSIPAAKSAYTASINQCISRSVYDVNIVLGVTWLGGTQVKVDCTLKNNEGSTYDGRIQVAICEKVSSRGWIDTGGVTYTQTFLAWAFNEPVSISSGGTWSDSMTWDGSSNGYPTITEGNTIVIAAAYNDDWHQGYSYPPSSNPFNAYYVDDCVEVEPGGGSNNNPPEIPTITGPTNGNAGTSYTYTFNSVDPDGDDVFYYIKWDDGNVEVWDGPHASGANANFAYTYTKEGTFTIEAKAKDIYGEESGWGTLTVTMPRTKSISNTFLLNILKQMSQFFPIFNKILNL